MKTETAGKILLLFTVIVLLFQQVQVLPFETRKKIVQREHGSLTSADLHSLMKRGVETQGGLEIVAQCMQQCNGDQEQLHYQIILEPAGRDHNPCVNVCNVTYVKKDQSQPQSSRSARKENI